MWSGAVELTTAAVLVAHASMVPAGGGVIAALLAPGGRPLTPAPGSDRVERLRALASAGRLAEAVPPVLPALPVPGPAAPGRPGSDRLSAATWLQLAAVCTVASAVVHACAGPHHAEEHLAFGLFFYIAAFIQFCWTTQVLMSVPTRSQLWQALWLNVFLVVLWAVSRTVGLPFGILPQPEEVGAWDLTSKIWEVGAAVCCVVLLRRPAEELAADVRRDRHLTRPVLVVSGASALVLLLLALSGQPT